MWKISSSTFNILCGRLTACPVLHQKKWIQNAKGPWPAAESLHHITLHHTLFCCGEPSTTRLTYYCGIWNHKVEFAYQCSRQVEEQHPDDTCINTSLGNIEVFAFSSKTCVYSNQWTRWQHWWAHPTLWFQIHSKSQKCDLVGDSLQHSRANWVLSW